MSCVTLLLVLLLTLMAIFSAVANAICYYSFSGGQNSTISSPNYPLPYNNSLNCTYQISVPAGYSLYIRFTEFVTEKTYDRLKFSCASGTPFGPKTFSGTSYPATLFISSCSVVKLLFTSDSSRVDKGFSLFYSFVQASTPFEGFQIKPSNIFLQANQETTPTQYTFNCSSSSGYLPWWSYKGYNTDEYDYDSFEYVNDTVTNGFCKVSPSYNSTFISESLGPGSCNLIATGSFRPFIKGTFICNYGTSASAAALLATLDPGFRFSKRLGGSSFPTLVSLSLTRGDEVQFTCAPQSLNISIPEEPPSMIQIRILRSYWINGTGRDASNIIANYNESNIVVRVDPVSSVLPSYKCGVDAQLFWEIPGLDNTIPIFKTDAIRVNVRVFSDTISITGGELGKIPRGGVLSCYSPAYPPPTYSWTDVSTGQQVIGPQIAVIHSGQYTCTATNVFNGELFQGSKSIMVEISEDQKSQGLNAPDQGLNASSQGLNAPTIILVVVLGAGLFIISIVFTSAAFYLLKKRLRAVPTGKSTIDLPEHELVGRRQLPGVPESANNNRARYVDTPVTQSAQPSSDDYLTPEDSYEHI